MKKQLCAIIACLLLFSAVLGGCSPKQSLYNQGLEITAIMEEMLTCEAFSEMYQITDFSDILTQVKAADYQSPKAVYAITTPSTEDMLVSLGMDVDWWGGLSHTMKEQIDNRVSFQSIISAVNGRAGTDKIAFSSVYFAIKEDECIDIEDEVAYLYTFDNGTPIAVVFSPNGSANGHFLFAEDIDTIDDVRKLFEPSRCAVKEITIP